MPGRGPDDDTISRYSDPGYVIGDSTPGALEEISERFRQSTLELAASGPTDQSGERVYELAGSSSASLAELDAPGTFI